MNQSLFPAVAAIVLALTCAAGAGDFRAVDGDTIAIGTEHVRIIGLDAPETFHSRCPAEKRLGIIAKMRLQAYLDRGPVRIERAKRLDKYGRTLALVFVDDRDVAGIMITDGLAVPYNGRGRRIDWCARLNPPAPPEPGPGLDQTPQQ